MLRVFWRGFTARKTRAALTALAIALGVALMAGTYILTDTINASFASIFASSYATSSAVVSPSDALGSNNAPQISPITEPMLEKVRQVPGVAEAAGDIFGPATLLGPKGRSLSSFAPGLVGSVQVAPFETTVEVLGHLPVRPDQADLDQMTMQRARLHLGDVIQVAGVGPARRYTLVGTYRLPGASSFGGASVAMLVLPQAQAVMDETGRFDEIDVSARPGVTSTELVQRLKAALPGPVVVRTGSEEAAQQAANSASQLSFLRTFLLVFAYVALFVGGFIILNTFSITIAQRTRELGLMRAMGASRRQVLSAVVGESLVLGFAGSVLGLGLGMLAAPGLDDLFKSFGADLPDSGTVLEARTVVVSLLAGVGVSVISGLAPALRATRTPPVAALRDGVPPEPGRLARYSLPISLTVLAGGALLLGGGLAGNGDVAMVGAGGLLVFVGVALLSPRFVPGLAKVLGAVVAWRGVTGRLARENARRQPGRTAVTASALMIGLALVTFVSIVASGTKATIDSAVNGEFAGNLIVENSSTVSNQGIPASLASALSRVPGISTVAAVNFSEARVSGISGEQLVTGVYGPALSKLYKVVWDKGSEQVLAQLHGEDAIVTKSFARSHGLRLGRELGLLTPSGRHLNVVVQGIASDRAGLFGDITLSRTLVQQAFAQSTDGVDFASYAPGAANTKVQPAVDRLLTQQYAQAKSLTAAQFEHQQGNQVDSLLDLIYVLLALAVIVSLFGLVNTLALSIYERARELARMRAVGTSRRQVRQVIRYESVVTSLIGAVTGLVVGLVFGVVIVRSLGGSGAVVSVPVSTLLVLIVLAGLAGVGAATLPARRAAKLDVLSALSAE